MIRDERQNLVIQHIYGGDWCFCRVELCESYFAAGINDCLLINMSDTFQVAKLERVLRAKIN